MTARSIFFDAITVRSRVCLGCLALFWWCASAQAQTQSRNLYVDGHRPVAKAIELLSLRHSAIITYEDPTYEYQGDIKDITLQVRRDLHRYPPGKAPKILVPARGSFSMSYMVAESGAPRDMMTVLEAILAKHEAAATGGGRFRIERSSQALLHVIPTETRNADGQWVREEPLLDATITIPSQKLNGFEMLRAICHAVREATGKTMVVGTIPNQLFLQYEGNLAASDETARDVLIKALGSVNERLTWRLLYGISPREQYALNIRLVAPDGTDASLPDPVGRPPSPRRDPNSSDRRDSP